MTEWLNEREINCPYCGELITLLVDASAGDQTYIEDCPICCCPMELQLRVSNAGEIESFIAKRDNE